MHDLCVIEWFSEREWLIEWESEWVCVCVCARVRTCVCLLGCMQIGGLLCFCNIICHKFSWYLHWHLYAVKVKNSVFTSNGKWPKVTQNNNHYSYMNILCSIIKYFLSKYVQ
jgi:hypothetical protein